MAPRKTAAVNRSRRNKTTDNTGEGRDLTMVKQAHHEAAAHHETAARSHKTAAEHHEKGDKATASKHPTEANGHAAKAPRALRQSSRQIDGEKI